MDAALKYIASGTEMDVGVLELVSGLDPAINKVVDIAKCLSESLGLGPREREWEREVERWALEWVRWEQEQEEHEQLRSLRSLPFAFPLLPPSPRPALSAPPQPLGLGLPLPLPLPLWLPLRLPLRLRLRLRLRLPLPLRLPLRLRLRLPLPLPLPLPLRELAAAFAVTERKTDIGNFDGELVTRVYAVILVMIEDHRLGGSVDVFEHVLDDLQYLARLFQELAETPTRRMAPLLQNNAENIASCRARLNSAMERYAVDSRIRNAVGLAELGTGIRTVRELTVAGIQEHQLAPPFILPTSSSGSLVGSTAPQIAWMASNAPWNSSGHFADLFIGWHTIVGKVALKRLRIDDTLRVSEAVEQRFERERDMWQRLRHDNILQLLESFNHDGFWYFVSPFMKNGSLAKYIKRDPLVNRTGLLREIANAIMYLHAESIVHGDIKADNILLSDDFHAQLCDFGLAKFFGTRTATALKGTGSVQWQSPELWEGKPKTAESDVYAFGMTIVEVLTGDVPFPDLNTIPVLYRNVHLLGQRPPKEPGCSSSGESYKDAWTVAEQCWPADPKERISMSEAFTRLDPNAEREDETNCLPPSLPEAGESKADDVDRLARQHSPGHTGSQILQNSDIADVGCYPTEALPFLPSPSAQEKHHIRSTDVSYPVAPEGQNPGVSASLMSKKRSGSTGSSSQGGTEDDEGSGGAEPPCAVSTTHEHEASLVLEDATDAPASSAPEETRALPGALARGSSEPHLAIPDRSPAGPLESKSVSDPNSVVEPQGTPHPLLPTSSATTLDATQDTGATSRLQRRRRQDPPDHASLTEVGWSSDRTRSAHELFSDASSRSRKTDLGHGNSTARKPQDESLLALDNDVSNRTGSRDVVPALAPTEQPELASGLATQASSLPWTLFLVIFSLFPWLFLLYLYFF